MRRKRDQDTITLNAAFIRMMTDAQFALFSYVLLLVGDAADARDVLQDTNLTILRDASHYRPGTPFVAWAKTLAYYQVLTYRKKKSRDRLVFDDEVFQRLTEHLAERPERANRRLDAVTACIKKLNDAQQALVNAKYFERLSIDQITERFGYSQAAAVSLLYRVRRLLAECVQATLKSEGT